MKTFLRLITLILLVFISYALTAQIVPQKMNYQAVARDASGNPLSNRTIGLKFTIHESSATGPTVYSETMTATTNQLGTFSVEIGGGTPVYGSFATIPWSNGPKFLQIQLDPNGGTSYVDMGSYQLLSVAYAQYAKDVLNNDDGDANSTNELQTLSFSGSNLSISNGNTVTLTDTDPTNELQTLSLSGNQLSISSGNTVTLPGGGGGTPGGANGNVQFNNAGAFGGDPAFDWNNTVKRLTISNSAGPQALFKSTGTYGGIDLDGNNGWAVLGLNNAGVQKWRLLNNPLASNAFQISLATDDYKFTIQQDGKVGIGTQSGAIGGQMEIKSNSSTTLPTLLLTESEAEYSRLMFKNTVNTTKNWAVAAVNDATDNLSLMNFWYYNGTAGKDILTINGGTSNVGINTYTPKEWFDIYGGSYHSYMMFHNDATTGSATRGFKIGLRSDGVGFIWQYENQPIHFGTNLNTRMTILGNGNVGINNTSPDATLRVDGTTKFGSNGVAFSELRELTGTTGATGNYTQIDIPSGYTKANMRILVCEINYLGTMWMGMGGTDNPGSNINKIFYLMDDTKIWIYYPPAAAFQNKAIRLLLMKIG